MALERATTTRLTSTKAVRSERIADIVRMTLILHALGIDYQARMYTVDTMSC